MKVADEKILLIAKESKSPYEIFNAVRQVVNNCVVEPDFNIRSLATFDIDYLFVKLRSMSIGNEISVTYLDYEDDKEYIVKINLDQVEVKRPEKQDLLIKINDTNSLQLKYPSCMVYDSPVFKEDGEISTTDLFNEFVIDCLDKYFEGETVHKFADYSRDQLKEFVEELDLKTYSKIKEFVENIPSLYHETEYTNSKGTKQKIKSSTLNDFFTW